MTTLDERKDDKTLLLRTLGITAYANDNHLPCKWCSADLGKDKKTISVWRAPDAWAWKCHRCNRSGTIVDALAEVEGITVAEAIKRLAPRERPGPPAKQKPALPVLTPAQKKELTDYVDTCLGAVLQEQPMVKHYAKRRGLSLTTLGRWCVGFDIRERRWIFPITDVKGNVKGVKFHKEDCGPGESKSGWVRFAPKPAKCGWQTFFPLPETFAGARKLAIAEGELKALALMSGGLPATAPTTGAGFQWPDFQARRFRGQNVVVVFDDDAAGRKFRDRAVAALRGIAVSVDVFTFKKGA